MNTHINAIRGAFLLFTAVSSTPAFAEMRSTSELRVHVVLEPGDTSAGKVMCDLYSSPDGFPVSPSKALAYATASIVDHDATCVFSGWPRGTYAVGAFHDRNSNGKMDWNFIGIPKEPFGVSQDAKSLMSSPSFAASAFQYPGTRLEIVVHLRHL